MNLDEAQAAKVRQWVDEGLKASDIQTKLMAELGLKLTYAEVRFLLGDLQLRPKDPPPAPEPKTALANAASTSPAAAPGSGAKGPGGLGLRPVGGPGEDAVPGVPSVTVSVDDITRPNMVVSGKVTFSDGTAGEWGIDRMGRPVLKTSKPGYHPPQEDLMEFQAQLEQVLARFGY